MTQQNHGRRMIDEFDHYASRFIPGLANLTPTGKETQDFHPVDISSLRQMIAYCWDKESMGLPMPEGVLPRIIVSEFGIEPTIRATGDEDKEQDTHRIHVSGLRRALTKVAYMARNP